MGPSLKAKMKAHYKSDHFLQDCKHSGTESHFDTQMPNR